MDQRMCDFQFLEALLELLGSSLGDRTGTPLVVVLAEDLYAVAACLVGTFDGLVKTAGNRHVGAKDGHVVSP
jgi:hypothetical protein